MVDKKKPRRRAADLEPAEAQAKEKQENQAKLEEKVTKLREMIDLIDSKIKEKIEDDMQRVRIQTMTAEREMEGYSLTELRSMRETYVKELRAYEKELATLSGKTQSRMIRPFFRR